MRKWKARSCCLQSCTGINVELSRLMRNQSLVDVAIWSGPVPGLSWPWSILVCFWEAYLRGDNKQSKKFAARVADRIEMQMLLMNKLNRIN